MKANLNRGIVILTTMLAGLIVGLFAGAYIYYAWAPPETILRNASPKYLNSDAETRTPQYRDFYVVRVANKYRVEVQANAPDPLKTAYDVLGVTTGDATIDEAIAMARASEKVAMQENNVNGDAGQFTRNEELSLGALATALEAAKTAGTYPKIDTSKYVPLVARTNARVAGLIILVLLLAVAGLIIYLIDHWVGARASSATTINQIFRVTPNSGLRESLTNPIPSNVTVNVGQTSPGAVGVASAPARAAGNRTSSEVALATFAPTVYRHGDDHFDEDFAINGPMGELVGECGASIADRVGVDTPARVSALALWVFDKNDFQSTTKVLMTDLAWNDPVVRNKLKARGDAVQADVGSVVEILTSTLRVEVQVSDLTFNTDNNAPRSYFQSVTLTFSVYKRSQTA